MIKRKGLLLVVSGPSGAGKGTICKEILNRRKDIKLSVSATTRKPRERRSRRSKLLFLSKEEFSKMVDNGEF